MDINYHMFIPVWWRASGSRYRGGRGRHGGAGVPGAVRGVRRLPLPPQQPLLRAAVPPRHAAGRHDALLARRHRRARPQLPVRLQLRRVHRRRRRARRQARRRRPAAGAGVPARLRRVHRYSTALVPHRSAFRRATRADADASFVPFIAGVGAAWKVAAVEPGSTVAVFGLGAVGLAVRTTNLLIALLRNTHFFVFVWTSLLQTHLSLAP